MTVERVVEVREKKRLVLAKSKHRLFLLFRAVVFAVGDGASGRAASANNVHHDVAAGQTRILGTAAVLHCAGDLRPSVFRVTSIKETLVSFGLHCWLIDLPLITTFGVVRWPCCCWAAIIQRAREKNPGRKVGGKFKIKAEKREAKSINVSRQVPSTLRDTLTARSLLRITAQLILDGESERASERARAAPGRTERRRLNSGADGRTDGSGG